MKYIVYCLIAIVLFMSCNMTNNRSFRAKQLYMSAYGGYVELSTMDIITVDRGYCVGDTVWCNGDRYRLVDTVITH